MKNVDYDRIKDAEAYLYLKRWTLEGGGCFILFAEKTATGVTVCCKAAVAHVDTDLDNPRHPGHKEPARQWHLFDETIDCQDFRRDLDFLVDAGLLEGEPEKVDYCTFNRSDLILIRTFDGRKGVYDVAPVSWEDPRYHLVLNVLRKYDPENRFEELTTH